MNKTNIFGFMAGLVLAFSAVGCGQNPSSQHVQHVEVGEFLQRIQDSTVVVVDVRSLGEHAAGCIPETDLNIDVMGADFKTRVGQLIPEHSVVAVYCRSGNRSKRAAKILSEMGYEVLDLDHGYKAWVEYNKQ